MPHLQEGDEIITINGHIVRDLVHHEVWASSFPLSVLPGSFLFVSSSFPFALLLRLFF